MAIYQGYKSELLKSQRAYLPNDIIFEFDDNKPNRVRMKTGKLHTFDIYRRLPYVSCICECHDYGKGFVINIGNNRDKEFVVNHNLNSNHIIVQVYDNETKILNETEIDYIDENNIKIIFNNIPKNDQYRVLVYSTRFYTDPGIGNEDDLNYIVEHGIGTNDIVASILNTESNKYEHTQIKNVDMSSDKIEISFKNKIKNNQYLISMESGNYSQTITLNDNTNYEKVFKINHNLDCEDIIVQAYNLTFKNKLYSNVKVKIIDNSNLEISFNKSELQEFQNNAKIRIVLLDVRDVQCCYDIESNKYSEIKHEQENGSWIIDGKEYYWNQDKNEWILKDN